MTRFLFGALSSKFSMAAVGPTSLEAGELSSRFGHGHDLIFHDEYFPRLARICIVSGKRSADASASQRFHLC